LLLKSSEIFLVVSAHFSKDIVKLATFC
jgi:hypothetical protein